MAREVILPKLGQTMEQGAIVEWFKQEGDEVSRGEVLFTVESDKATLEVEAPARGFLRKILVQSGVMVPVLTPVGIITRTADEDIAASEAEMATEPAAAPMAAAQPEVTAEPAAAAAQPQAAGRVFASPRARMRAQTHHVELGELVGTGPEGRIVERDVLEYVRTRPKITPVARKRAAELGVNLTQVTGTGVGGKIVREDVEAAAEPAPTPRIEPAPQIEAAPKIEPAPLPAAAPAATVPMAGLRRIIAERMSASVQTTARVTLVTEADATFLVEARTRLKDEVSAEWGFTPGYNDLVALIVARALRAFPYMNVRLTGEGIEQLPAVNLGLAVDTERGLLVPVIRDADQLGLRGFGARFRELVERARQGKSQPDDLSGGTFTITNLGMYDVDAFTPIINLPETAILGVGRIQAKPAVYQGLVAVRQMVTLSLAFDHRLVDGAPAARFLQRIKQMIENPYLLLA